MRIAGGEWRGRPLKTPPGETVRPTQDRVREALFSMLQGVLPGASVLDLFAGSGGVGLEALSRGAARATFVDASPVSLKCLTANAAALTRGGAAHAGAAGSLGAAGSGGAADGRIEIVRADALRWTETAGAARAFDLAFADPPYALGADGVYGRLLAALATHDVVRPDGLFIAEMTSSRAPDESPLWDLLRDRAYGQTRLAVYRRR